MERFFDGGMKDKKAQLYRALCLFYTKSFIAVQN